MSSFNTKRYVFASLAAYVFIFAFDFALHGKILKPTYEATQSLWRLPEDTVLWAMMLGQFILPFIVTYIFTKGYEERGAGEGLRFGFLIGLLCVPENLIMYAVQPFPLSLVGTWMVGGIIEMMGAGLIIAKIYKPA